MTRIAAFRRALAVLGLAFAAALQAAPPAAVSLETARADLEAGRALMIDIREPDEYRATGVAAGAMLLPMSQLPQRAREIPAAADQPVLLICNTQNRSRRTLDALRKAGWQNVRYVEGGMSEWVRRGWPVVPPPAPAAAPSR